MSVFFCDSVIDISAKTLKKLGAKIIEMPYSVNGEVKKYKLEENFNYEEFYSLMKSGASIEAVELTTENYVKAFEKHLKNGEDIIYVHFSRELSNSMDNLDSAVSKLRKKYSNQTITLVDTNTISVASGLIVLEALKMHNQGATHQEIARFVKNNRKNTTIYFALKNLDFLKETNKISKTRVNGKLLSVRPIAKVNENGDVEIVENAQGSKKAITGLVNKVKEIGQNVNDYPVYVMHSHNEKGANELKAKLIEYLGEEAGIIIKEIGPIIGAHCGLDVLGVVFHSKCR